MINLLAGIIWAIYFLAFLIIKIGVSPENKTLFRFSSKFKILSGVIAVFHFIVYVFYIGEFGVLKESLLNYSLYPLLFVIGIILIIAGLLFSIFGYYQFRRIETSFFEQIIGFYKKIRWPVALGLIFLWFGVSLIYNNWFGVIIGLTLFVPMIYYQMKSEEEYFIKIFQERGLGEKYENYIKNTGLIFPKFFKS